MEIAMKNLADKHGNPVALGDVLYYEERPSHRYEVKTLSPSLTRSGLCYAKRLPRSQRATLTEGEVIIRPHLMVKEGGLLMGSK